MKEYIDINYMAQSVLQIFKDERDGFKDGNNNTFLDENYSDEYLENRAYDMANSWNNDMCSYLHKKDTRIYGNFNNVNYDYNKFRNGKVAWNDNLLKGLVERLDNNAQDEQTKADRRWLVDWFFETFGTFGIRYNFDSEMSDAIYNYKLECDVAIAS